MKTTIKDNVLHIEIPLHAPRPSATGRTLTVASSNGNKETEARINGKPVIVGVNAYIKPVAYKTQDTREEPLESAPAPPNGSCVFKSCVSRLSALLTNPQTTTKLPITNNLMNLHSNTLREAKRLFSRLKHLRCKLPVLNHLLLTAGQDGIRLAATDLDQWLETRISDLPTDDARFLIPPSAMDAACRADKGTQVSFTPCGGKRNREIRVTLTSGGIQSTSVHPTLDPGELPSRPLTIGSTTELPPATLQGLADIAGCASTDPIRHILNGVLFTPEDGGRLVATDGRRLACCPATVPPQSFILPSAACHILGHPDFLSNIATITWMDHEDAEKRRVSIECGRHLLVSKPLVGTYPNYKQVIPASAEQLAVIPHDRKPGLIAWLRSLGKDQCSVRLDWHKRGQLTLTHRDANGHSATMQVPVEIHGNPPVIAFNARYLAEALEIGSTLCLSDELSPGICRHPTGRFCVIMPMRVTIPAGTNRGAEAAPPQHSAQAAAA